MTCSVYHIPWLSVCKANLSPNYHPASQSAFRTMIQMRLANYLHQESTHFGPLRNFQWQVRLITYEWLYIHSTADKAIPSFTRLICCWFIICWSVFIVGALCSLPELMTWEMSRALWCIFKVYKFVAIGKIWLPTYYTYPIETYNYKIFFIVTTQSIIVLYLISVLYVVFIE